MNKKIILGLIILVVVSGLVYGAYSILKTNETQENISVQNNTTETINNTTNEETNPVTKESNEAGYGTCPICGRWVKADGSHSHPAYDYGDTPTYDYNGNQS